MSRHGLPSPWNNEGRDCEACRDVTERVVAEWAQLLLACAAVAMLVKAVELLS